MKLQEPRTSIFLINILRLENCLEAFQYTMHNKSLEKNAKAKCLCLPLNKCWIDGAEQNDKALDWAEIHQKYKIKLDGATSHWAVDGVMREELHVCVGTPLLVPCTFQSSRGVCSHVPCACWLVGWWHPVPHPLMLLASHSGSTTLFL